MRLILAVLCLLSAGPALAQAVPATPQEVATARAEADRLISQGDARGVFENITGDARPTVIHAASGLICRFEAGHSGNRIAVYPAGPGMPRGSDVGCNLSADGIEITHYATRYAPAISAEQGAREAAGHIVQRFEGARRYEGPAMDVGSPDLPVSYYARFVVSSGSQSYYTHAVTADVRGWIFKQRLSALESRAEEAQVVGLSQWVGTLAFAQARPFDAPAAD